MGTEINYSGKPPEYYAPFEVVVHNTPEDCWVSFLGKVANLTPLIEQYKDKDCVRPLIAFAGKDISDWFDEKTGDIQYHIHPVSGCRVPYTPHGRIPDVNVQVPNEEWRPLDHLPWWKDDKYVIGKLTSRVRPIRVINPTFGLETYLNVCSEDTILRIKERYSIFNAQCHDYIWRFFDTPLYDDKTLEENGVPDQRDHMASVGMDPNFWTPPLFIYFCDDLSWLSDSSSDSEPDNYYSKF